MNTSDQAIIISLAGAPDPLLEEIISAEGYQISHVASVQELIANRSADDVSLVAMLFSNATALQISELSQLAAEQLATAKFLLCMPNRQDQSHGPEIPDELAERVLMLYGEPGATDNVRKIRSFLRGEGYHWASDLPVPDYGVTSVGAPMTGSEEEQRIARLTHHFASDLSKFSELRSMLHDALVRYLAILECDAGSVYLWNESVKSLILEAAIGPDSSSRLGLRQKLGEGLAGWVAEVGEPILVTDTRKVHKLRGRNCARYSNFSCLAVPLTHAGQLFGVVCLTMPHDNEAFEPKDLHLAQALGQRLASVIRPLSVLSELRRFSERLLGAFQTSSKMLPEDDPQLESLQMLQSNILDHMPLAVIAYDHTLRIRTANKIAGQQFGVDIESASSGHGLPLEDGLDLDPGVWRRKLQSVVEDNHTVRIQRAVYCRGDVGYMLDIICSPLRDVDGQTMGGIIVIQDITEDIEMEAKLSSAERLALVGKLAAKVAHELNNPLDGILRFVNLAMRKLDDPKQAREYLEESRHGLLRMSHILTELLTFSRSQRGGNHPTSLSQVICQSLAQYEQRAREYGVKIDLEVPSDLPACSSNDVWEVFGNVIKNAIDSMADGGALTVHARREDSRVRVTVSDTGKGVPQELEEKIFEPFFTTKKGGLGTGLGLALCRDSLRRIGGDIQLLPSENGAVFEIIVPTQVQPE